MSSTTTQTAVSRRGALLTAGAAGVAAATAAGGAKLFTPALAAATPKVRLAWTEVAACHSPLAFGVANGFYKRENVDVELFYQGASGQTLIQALATNKADVGAGLILDWLKPLEQGFDVKLIVGSHGCCQRILASPASGITNLAGLKNKKIAVVLPRRQHRRFAQPGDPPGDHHACATDRGGAAGDRRHPRLRAPVNRHRAH